MSVFVLDKGKRPLMPCSEQRARKLLEAGRARVHRMLPFTIRLVDRKAKDCELQPMRLSIDPGSKFTGLCVGRVEAAEGDLVLHIAALFELLHRGQAIRDGLQRRAMFRRSRRGRKRRYRAPRFLNRGGDRKGWFAPSLIHRVHTTMSWIRRLLCLAPVTSLAQELVRFDMQLMQAKADGREIEGVAYQHGELFGFEVGEYLLAKWGRKCVYCDTSEAPLEKDHVVPRCAGGSDRISNLTLACRSCNQRKGSRDVRDFLGRDPQRLARVLAQAKTPLKDAAAVNATRVRLHAELRATGLPVETGSGGLTKFNRTRLGISKSHALDAACVGRVHDVRRPVQPTLHIRCNGRGSRSRTRLDASGFPRGYLMRGKSVQGFRTGDMVTACVPAKSKKAGVYRGRVAIRQTGSFNIQTARGVVQGISHRHCSIVMRGDGYSYRLVAQKLRKDGAGATQHVASSYSRTRPTESLARREDE